MLFRSRPPEMPLTTLEKRWLKTVLSDPRIRLFDPGAEGFEGVEPLYDPGMIEYFDRYADGDPYEDETYIQNFRMVLRGLREKRRLEVRFTGQRGIRHIWNCAPVNLEYSSKDDKFRLLARRSRGSLKVINLARITSCQLLEPFEEAVPAREDVEKDIVVIELTDQRNTLERTMLHFSHFAKETERIGEGRYRLTVEYDKDDATEMLIRVLGFGPTIRVVSPDSFIEMIKERIEMQKDCGLL